MVDPRSLSGPASAGGGSQPSPLGELESAGASYAIGVNTRKFPPRPRQFLKTSGLLLLGDRLP